GGRRIAPVLKSNAYGHGLFETAAVLELHDHIPFFVVDSYFEAVALRAKSFRTPILIIGYTRPEIIAKAALKDVAFTVTSMEQLRLFGDHHAPCPEYFDQDDRRRRIFARPHRAHIHLKIDTGMRRQGILSGEIDEAIAILKESEVAVLDGVCTHFSDADNEDSSFTEAQIAEWNRAVARFRAAFPRLKHAHAAATDGARFSDDIDADTVRLGIGLYGLSQNSALDGLGLQPVMEISTIVTGVKKLAAGETVGYGNSFAAAKDMTVATIPFGYYEGFDRRMSSGPDGAPRAFVQVGPDRIPCPIVGRISMNIASIDVTKVPSAAMGTKVVVFSADRYALNSIDATARNSGTISYEIAVKIPAHLKRTLVE
ncbi:MAG: alanine racemase, partial [Patescibacteria group bacterium]|nr:alanine racemase [Patescibacteria group bacterium]